MNKNEVIAFIKNELESGKIRKDMFPMMTEFGVRDYSETVHSLGLNYITEVGRHINGVAAVSEYPVYAYGDVQKNHYKESVAEEAVNYSVNNCEAVRPDSIWFSKVDNKPVLICEFERYEKNRKKDNKLREKIQNLLIAYHQMGGDIPVILFIYWSYSAVNAAEINEYVSILDTGFKQPNGKIVHGINGVKTTYLVYRCIAAGNNENLKLDQWIEAG